MVINPPKATDSKITVKADEEEIEIKKQLKLLGVIIDDQMNFGEHIREISRKASQRLGVLNQFRNNISTASKLTIYKTSIMPYVTYCITVWHFAKSSDLRKVERMQEKAMKIIYYDKSSSYEQLLKRAKLPTLQNRRIQDIAILMYKVKHELVPEYISKLFEMPNQHYALRNNDFVIPRYRTVMNGKHSIRYFGPYIWSKLSSSTREKPSLDTFRKTVRLLDLTNIGKDSCNGQCKFCNG
eukprot:gene4329-4902_t